MSDKIALFENKKIRSVWVEEEEQWYFSIVDVVGALTDSANPRKYWSVLKSRLKTREIKRLQIVAFEDGCR